MADTPVNEGLLQFKAESLSADTFVAVAFIGDEAISRPFRFEIELESTDADVLVADVVGKKGTFTVVSAVVREEGARRAQRKIHGLVAEFEYKGFTNEKHRYRAVLVPQLWQLSLRYDNELYLNMSVPDVIDRVMSDAGITYGADLNASFAKKDVFTQYQETDLAFISRVAEHHGISYRFLQAGDEDKIEFFDRSADSPAIDGETKIKYEPDESLVAVWKVVSSFTESERMVMEKVIVKDYNYRDPETALISEEAVDEGSDGTRYFEYGTHHSDQDEGDYMARIRKEEIECSRRLFRGHSREVTLAPGFKFTLEDHGRRAMNGDYLITEVRSRGEHNHHRPSGEVAVAAAPYLNEFTCIPLAVPYRPPRVTPIPKVAGVMTAKTETAGGDYAHIDEFGRYRVKMHFDLSDASNGEASSWIRMSQPYSGGGYGMHFPNHANTEIVWACVNGDPDRPMAIGTAPNPSNESPVSSANRAENVIRTMGQNELTMDDTRGKERVYIHATRDNEIDVVNNQEVSIGANRTITVGGAHTETIRGSMTLDVGASSSETVALMKTVTVGAAMSVSVGAVLNETVGGAKTEQVGGISSESVGAAKTLNVGGILTTVVGGGIVETVGGNKVAMVRGSEISKINGSMVAKVGGAAMIKAKSIMLNASDMITLKCGGSSIILRPGKIQIKGDAIQVKASGNVVVKGSQVKIN